MKRKLSAPGVKWNFKLGEYLAKLKGLPHERIKEWKAADLLAFACLISFRAFRGSYWHIRFHKAKGLILCGPMVRIYHPRYISTGPQLNIEEGCEIVGLSKRGIVFGKRCTVGRFASIRPTNVLLDEPGEGLRLGDHSNIGPYSYIGCSGYIEIGNNVMIGPRVNLIAENHNFDRPDIPMKNQGVTRSFIKIEDDCWLGVGSTVLGGVTVGRSSIVAAGAVVRDDVSPYTIVAGVPAKIINLRRLNPKEKSL